MTEEQEGEQYRLRQAVEDAITTAIENEEGYYAALGRTISLLDEYDVTGASRDDIVHEFEAQAEVMGRKSELLENEDEPIDE